MSAIPIMRAQGEGEKRWFLGGGLHTWKATAEETDGAFFVFEDLMERGKATPLHRHPDADEIVYLIEGELRVRIGDQERVVSAGNVTVSPRGVEHAFTVLSETARLLTMQTPGGGDRFYRGASDPTSQTDAAGPVDFQRVGATAAETGAMEILGPPPFTAAQGANVS
jgi:quercetin dioxygenase-like cupin family protein